MENAITNTILSIPDSNAWKKNGSKNIEMSNSERIKHSPICISTFPIIKLIL